MAENLEGFESLSLRSETRLLGGFHNLKVSLGPLRTILKINHQFQNTILHCKSFGTMKRRRLQPLTFT